MGTLPEVLADLELIAEAHEQALVYFRSLDAADGARNGEEKPRFTSLRTKLELCGEALERVKQHLPSPPFIESCIPPASSQGGTP